MQRKQYTLRNIGALEARLASLKAQLATAALGDPRVGVPLGPFPVNVVRWFAEVADSISTRREVRRLRVEIADCIRELDEQTEASVEAAAWVARHMSELTAIYEHTRQRAQLAARLIAAVQANKPMEIRHAA